ncbi:hypothetical protein HYT55_02195 [Candidatus Woesearchaeota archaeon]|nr:hypothetical protein [Candidatus Woesearchaeota archaeon]
MELFNPWLTSSLLLLAIWFVIWFSRPRIRKELLWVSLFTLPFGLTEPLFVPEYWNPPSLFNLAQRTGFDIESFIFCFAIGGIGAVLYKLLFPVRHQKVRAEERQQKSVSHWLALFSPFVIFIPLFLLTTINPIYSASIAVFFGSIATLFCRPDLKQKVLGGGLLFFSLYFIFFFLFTLFYPDIIVQVWNISALSGIVLWGVPLEELLFAFTFGMFWSSIYEQMMWYKLKR